MLFHVFRHVEAQHLDAERRGELLGHFGLADARRAREEGKLPMGFSGSRRPARASLMAEESASIAGVLAEDHALKRPFEILQHLGVVLRGRSSAGIRAILAMTASISFVPIVFRRFDSDRRCWAAPASSITSIALSGSFRSLM